MFRFGFSGTQVADERDWPLIKAIIAILPSDSRAIVGCCIGVDAMIARAATYHGMSVHAVVPAILDKIDPDWEMWCDTEERMPLHPGWTKSEHYMERNRRLATLSQALIAVPKEENEILRSGTWSTVRYARHLERPVAVVPLLTDPERVLLYMGQLPALEQLSVYTSN